MTRNAHALFSHVADAEKGFDALLRVGFSREQISVVVSDSMCQRPESIEERVQESNQAAKGAAVGGGLGGLLMGLIAAGTFAVAGPVAAILAGASLGGIGGSLVGMVVGSGVDPKVSKDLERSVQEGGVLLAVPVQENQEREVQNLLEQAGGKFVRST